MTVMANHTKVEQVTPEQLEGLTLKRDAAGIHEQRERGYKTLFSNTPNTYTGQSY